MAVPRLHIVLFNPEIPQNTGNIGRLCAFTDARLHLIHPLGFTITDRHLKRSGMDYWKSLDVHHHADWEAFLGSPDAPAEDRLWMFTTRATTPHWDASFEPGDGLLFGNEGHGCPPWLHERIIAARKLTLPRFSESPLRSLNLSTSVGIAAYEVFRQFERPSA
jgi:tRNA (cytidine/uridine-2'-O-)-methyltransferase